MGEVDLGLLALLRDVEYYLGALPLDLVFGEVQVVVSDDAGDALVGRDLDELHGACVSFLSVVVEFVAELGGATFDHLGAPAWNVPDGLECFFRRLVDRNICGVALIRRGCTSMLKIWLSDCLTPAHA
jgi:hypothetical protein